jgi:hypothetical protein
MSRGMTLDLRLLAAWLLPVLYGCNGVTDQYAPLQEGGATVVPRPSVGESPCGKCALSQCTTPACAADSSGCERYVTCLAACPTTQSGAADPVCSGRCLNSASSSAAVSAAVQCLASGGGAACGSCVPEGGIQGAGSSLLNQTCPAKTDVTACFACEDNNCCSTQANCTNDPECLAYEHCLKDCLNGVGGDAGAPEGGAPDGGACDQACYAAHPKGLTAWAPRETCVLVYCATPCGGSPDQCETCTDQYCATEYANLNGTPDGYLLGACMAACPVGANPCTAACGAQYPSAKPASDALVGCVALNCPSCG